MTETMSAAVFMGDGKLEIVERPVPVVSTSTDVLIKVENCGICGSDIAVLAVPPRHDAAIGTILGHEFSGYVQEVGSDVRGLKRGDRVVVAPNISCGECAYCMEGQLHHCINLTIHGIWVDGGLAPFVVVPRSACHPISAEVPRALAALVEPLSTAIRGLQQADPFPGDTVVVVGGGPIGLIFTALFKAAGTTVVVIEPAASRARLATTMGAAAVVGADSPELDSVITELTAGSGANIVVDAVGSQLATCLKLVKRQGRVVLFGVNTAAITPVQQFDITHRELEIVGAMVGTGTFPIAIRLIERGTVDLRPLLTHRIRLHDLPKALDELRSGEAVKVQVEFD